jgi:Fur family ferric uptake transcriptional regulator
MGKKNVGSDKAIGVKPHGVAFARPTPASFGWFWDSLDKYLEKHQLKQTKQRRVVVEHFLRLNTHLAAEELHEAVRRAGHNIGLATIYRTLNLLAQAGLAEQKSFGENHFVYEVRMPGEHHDHLICLDCGVVIEFKNAEIEALQEKVAASLHIKLAAHRLDLFGHCIKVNCEHRSKN